MASSASIEADCQKMNLLASNGSKTVDRENEGKIQTIHKKKN